MNITERAAKVLAEIEAALALAENATPGPWGTETAETDCGRACTPNGCCGHDSGVAERITGPALDLTCEGDVFEKLDREDGFHAEPWNSDMAFIAAARNGWPASLRMNKTAIEGLLREGTRYYGAGVNTPHAALTTLCDQWEKSQAALWEDKL